MRNFGYDESVISKTAGISIFPYEFIDSLDKLKYKGLPQKNKFYSSLKDSDVTQEDYAFALQVYDKAKCNNLKSYMRLYLLTDVLLLCESFQQLRSQMYSPHQLDPAYLVTLSSFGMEAALYHSITKLQLLTDIDVYTTFESQIRGGYVGANICKETFNSKYVENYDSSKSYFSALFLDFNSLYSTILNNKLPVDGFYELNRDEIKKFDIMNVDPDGDYAYALSIDYYIPEDTARYTDCLPLSMHHYKAKMSELSEFTKNLMKLEGMQEYCIGERLVASHLPQSRSPYLAYNSIYLLG